MIWLSGICILGACAVICRNDHCYASRAQTPHSSVKTTKNLGKLAHSDTRMPILCSKGPKTRVPDPKSEQKCRFCTRRSTEQHGEARRGREQPPETGQDRLERSATARSTTERNRHAMKKQKRRQPFGLSPLKIGGYLLSHMVVQYHRRK